jgi:hypothetical protein
MGLIVLAAGEASALNLPEGTSKLALGSEITRVYLIPLGLEGKPANESIGTLLAEGFRCNLEPHSTVVARERPLSDCIKKPSGFGPLCDELFVSLRFPHQEKILSRSELQERLTSIKVYAATAFCPWVRTPRAEYIAARHVGSETLTEQVRAFDLEGNAKMAYNRLMVEGYSCGFELDPATQKPIAGPKMICTQWPTKIKYCYEAKVMMDVQWGMGPTGAGGLLNELESSKVTEVHSSCEVPAPPT